MSKSVKSHNSSLSKRDKSIKQGNNIKVKQKIKEILYSVKQERQHIENRLHQNDLLIQQLRQDYQLLRYDHDFQHLNEEERTIHQQLVEGLTQMQIKPQAILGVPVEGKSKQLEQQWRELSKDQIIKVQEMFLEKLRAQLGE